MVYVPTVVYVPTRKETEQLAEWLSARGVVAHAYHAKLPKRALAQTHAQWRAGALDCVVATIAFGMGIDKSDVRRVVHYGWPQSLEALHQETGRVRPQPASSPPLRFPSHGLACLRATPARMLRRAGGA